MTMLAEVVDAVIGIDTHRDSHEVEIADAAGRPITTMRIGNDSAGFTQLLAASLAAILGEISRRCRGQGLVTDRQWRSVRSGPLTVTDVSVHECATTTTIVQQSR
jgi:hypothetical protein